LIRKYDAGLTAQTAEDPAVLAFVEKCREAWSSGSYSRKLMIAVNWKLRQSAILDKLIRSISG
jgi:hypothetical protein